METLHSYHFTYDHKLILSGVIVFEDIEIDGRVLFSFVPGKPMCGPSYASGGEPATDPEIEIQSIEIYGHPDTGQTTKGIYAVLHPSDPLWEKIETWLLDECLDDMCDAGADDPF